MKSPLLSTAIYFTDINGFGIFKSVIEIEGCSGRGKSLCNGECFLQAIPLLATFIFAEKDDCVYIRHTNT